ncbi:MAG: tyrosine-type recombinase/integrase [Acidobacteriota bacterium]
MKSEFTSPVGPTIERYLSLKVSLGRKYSVEHDVLKYLDSFLASVAEDLTAGSYNRWVQTQLHLTSGVRRRRMRIVRNLCLYRLRTEPDYFVPDLSEFPPPHQSLRPYIFSECEIVRLLEAAKRLCPLHLSPLRALVRLVVGDYEPSEKTLLIRESKFHKSRLLPLSSDAAQAIEAVLLSRRYGGFPVSADSPLLWSRYRANDSYSGSGLGTTLHRLFRTVGIRTEAGKVPRVHDMRHTFAVRALLRWYRRGEDVHTKLPVLAAYMGHVSIVSTEYYLPFVSELAEVAVQRFEQRYGRLIHDGPAEGGHR